MDGADMSKRKADPCNFMKFAAKSSHA